MTSSTSSSTAVRTLAVVTAGLSLPSSSRLLADRLSTATAAALERRGETVHIEVVELREHAHHLADNLLLGFPNAELRRALRAVTDADAVIAVTPVFSASFSGLFKMFVDVLDPDTLAGTPVLLGATAGTARHSLVLEHAMRPLFAYLRAVVVPTAVFAATEDWAGGTDLDEAAAAAGPAGALAERIERAAGELAELVAARPPATGGHDPFADAVPFATLLQSVAPSLGEQRQGRPRD